MAVWTPFGTTYLTGTLEAGKPVLPAVWNTYVRDNMQYIYDTANLTGQSVSYGTPSTETAGATAAEGVATPLSTALSRSDHRHAAPTTWPVTVQITGAGSYVADVLNFASGATVTDNAGTGAIDIMVNGAGGASLTFGDPTASFPGWTATAGVATSVSRSTHVHAREGTGNPVDQSQGTAQSLGTSVNTSLGGHIHPNGGTWAIAPLYVTNGVVTEVAATGVSRLNLIQGANVTITGVDNAAAQRVDVTFAATAAVQTFQFAKDGTVFTSRPKVNFIPGTGVTVAVTDDSANARTRISIGGTLTTALANVGNYDGNLEGTPVVVQALVTAAGANPGGSLAGTSTIAAREDHEHQLLETQMALFSTTATAVSRASVNAKGTSLFMARTGHVHGTPATWPIPLSTSTNAGSTWTAVTPVRPTINWTASGQAAVTVSDNTATNVTGTTGRTDITIAGSTSGASTWPLITRTLLASDTNGDFTFTGITQQFRHLLLRYRLRVTANVDRNMLLLNGNDGSSTADQCYGFGVVETGDPYSADPVFGTTGANSRTGFLGSAWTLGYAPGNGPNALSGNATPAEHWAVGSVRIHNYSTGPASFSAPATGYTDGGANMATYPYQFVEGHCIYSYYAAATAAGGFGVLANYRTFGWHGEGGTANGRTSAISKLVLSGSGATWKAGSMVELYGSI